jgi:hypothetical protein
MGMKKKAETPAIPAVPEVPAIQVKAVPSLPKTSVAPQPRNEESPVKPALKRLNENGKAGTETMTKADWSAKDRSIAMLALIADVFKSPVVAQMTMGKSDKDTLDTITKAFEHALKLYEDNK